MDTHCLNTGEGKVK